MPYLSELLRNYPLLIANIVLIIAQALKIITHYAVTGKLNFGMFISGGGMPSSHSAFVSSLAIAVGFKEGFDSSLFAICIVFGTIVMFDAAGVRQAASRQARIINQMVAELFEGHPISQETLKELLGHTPLQVAMGALFGIGFTLLWEFA